MKNVEKKAHMIYKRTFKNVFRVHLKNFDHLLCRGSLLNSFQILSHLILKNHLIIGLTNQILKVRSSLLRKCRILLKAYATKWLI